MQTHILVVDDDAVIQAVIKDVVTRPEYMTSTADSLQQALKMLQQQHYDLVIVDLNLPDGSGLHLLTEIKEHHCHTYSIVLTGFPEVESVQAALRAGVFDYLVKPIIPARLGHAVDMALAHKRAIEEQAVLRSRLEAVFQGVEDAIVALDDQWHIIQINESTTRLLGLAPESMYQPLQEAMGWLFDSVEPVLRQAYTHGGSKRTIQTQARHERDGEKILQCTASLFHDPMRKVPGVILVVRDESRLAMLEQETRTRRGWHGLVGASKSMQEIYALIERLAEVDSTVLITGETGTGKELVARALHDTSTRANRPFVAVNCAALPAGLLESELFGHVRGAFTHAVRDKVGRFKLADGGTIFLDEIGDLPMEMQVRLLRVLQEKTFEAVGDDRSIQVDVRIITATHRNLLQRVDEDLFRRDLYYRLKVVEIQLPPLRERKSDLPMLVDHFLTRFNTRMHREVEGISREVMAAMMDHDWPGNVRELEHLLEHAMVLAQGNVLTWADFPSDFRLRAGAMVLQSPSLASGTHGKPDNVRSKRADRETVIQALEAVHWQIQLAANQLGINRVTLWRHMKAMGIVPRNKGETRNSP